MKEVSRRTVIEQAGLALAAVVGVGPVRATSFDDGFDGLEEVRDGLEGLHDELQQAEDRLEELDHSGGFGNSGFGESGSEIPSSEALEDVEDEVVVNGIPASRLVPVNQTNGTNVKEFDETVRVNGVPVAVKVPEENSTEDGTTTSGESVSAADEESDSGSSPEFGGFNPEAGSSPSNAGSTSNSGSADSGSEDESQDSGGDEASGGQPTHREKRGTQVLGEVREEHSDVMETLDEIQVSGLQPVEREVSRTRHLLTEIKVQLDTAEQQLADQFDVAIETVEGMAGRVEERIDVIEDVMGDFDGGGSIGGFDDDFDDDFDGFDSGF